MSIIGLTGEAGAGKDTVGRLLVERHGYIRLSFADVMRGALLTLDPWLVPAEGGGPARLSTVVRFAGWEGAKRSAAWGDEVRRLLEQEGDALKAIGGDNVIIDAVARQMDLGRFYVITDLRFPNEAQFVGAHRGHVVEVVRPGNPLRSASTHASNRIAAAPWRIVNDGRESELAGKVAELLDTLRVRRVS